jgi:hypothetical protein
MPARRTHLKVRLGAAVAVVLLLAGCTKGGQLDPTEVFDADMFENKKKLQGDRQPLFPNGVPGAETGVPPDLVKGYQPPPEPVAQTADVTPTPAAEAKPKPKPKPKPQVARAPASPTPAAVNDPAWNQKPASPAAHDPAWDQPSAAAPPLGAQSGQTVWPASPQGATTQQAAQPAWPSPPAPGTATR